MALGALDTSVLATQTRPEPPALHLSRGASLFLRVSPLQGQDPAAPRASRLDPGVIVTSSRGHPREHTLAPQGHLLACAREVRGTLAWAAKRGAGPGVSVSPLPSTGDTLEPTGRSAPGQGRFLGWTGDPGSSGTSRMPAFQHRAHHGHGLGQAHDPPRLGVALLQGVLTGRTFVLFRVEVHRRAFTSVPGGAHAVESCVPASSHHPSGRPEGVYVLKNHRLE